ncbi:hypothetical protein H0H81_005262 [Sphagnurus paluster]|uniref:SAC3/GANP/THP3 conserved domain-containing protein n=1 Tax=Sphagnurus paluster TaxID=117069 RepID=A0A9P7GRZ8_9AGAR|nr:hypothetical protein H0H81_005262 [Sphagnurus paluster]
MESVPQPRVRGRGGIRDTSRQPHSRNRQWVAGESGQRSRSGTPYHGEGRGGGYSGHRGAYTPRGPFRGQGNFPNVSLRLNPQKVDHTEVEHEAAAPEELIDDFTEEDGMDEVEEVTEDPEEPTLDTPEEREKYYQMLVKGREIERKKAIAEGKMDDPSVPKRLEDAISVVGTCRDMCPRFERYRRERENNLFVWETIPGTKRVDHKRAVKMYERAAGDKTLPSDLRPPPVLKRTLDYLFHDLLPRGGFSPTFDFIRDRSRAVRNDFTMQHSYGPEAIECHDRCARFHILGLHFERDRKGFSVALEEQQLMNTLQSLKEFYEDQRGRYESPTELEMRVYHRLIHIRDQKERHEDIPEHITSHPVFKLTTDFRLHVQRKSAPISKTSALVVDAEGMEIFGNLANVLREQGSVVMIYLVACILERLFGKDAIDDIESIRGDLSIPDIIDGISTSHVEQWEDAEDEMYDELLTGVDQEEPNDPAPLPAMVNGTQGLSSPFGTSSFVTSQVAPPNPAPSAFSTISTTPNVFNTPSPFGNSAFPASSLPIFGVPAKSVFGIPAQSSTSSAGAPTNVFGTLSFPASTSQSTSIMTSAESTKPMNAFSSNMQNNAFNLDVKTSTIFNQPSVSSIPTLSPIPPNAGLTSNSNSTPTLNPMAASFTPKAANGSPSSSPFPTGLFQRSANPSPSPLPPNSNAPTTPTPPSISSKPSFSLPSSSPIKKTSPPPSQRTSTTPPTLPKINTNTSFTSSHQPATPALPPPLPKLQPISLPPTPSIFSPSKPILNFLKGSLATPLSSPGQEVLSPLFMPSPTTNGLLIHGFPTNGKKASNDQLVLPPKLSNGKGKAPTPPPINEQELENKSDQFARSSELVKRHFKHWHQRIVERAAWVQACEQSDAYKQKIKHQRQSLSVSHVDRKRRLSGAPGATSDTSAKKRARRRISSDYHPPRTDEDLARRFKEVHSRSIPFAATLANHEEHERRWAQGSFLNVVANHIKATLNGTLPHTSWRLWLSMNPDSDATAIWLERKFDVPASGDWISEAVFSIPLTRTQEPTPTNSPGLIVFECSPLGGVTDDLERKYRILDDCARLRDIISALPPKRHFVPSLLVISWTEEEHAKPPPDFIDMVNELLQSRNIDSYGTFSISSATKDLDNKLNDVLNGLPLDVAGKLVRPLNIRGMSPPRFHMLTNASRHCRQGAFKLFEPSFTAFAAEWVENCSVNGHFDWHIFGALVQAITALTNAIAASVCGLISEAPREEDKDLFPAFVGGDITDNNSAYDYIAVWLSAIGGNALALAQNLRGHRDIGQDFPAREFFGHLWELCQSQTETRLQPKHPHPRPHARPYDARTTPTPPLYVPISDIDAALGAQGALYAPYRAQLGKVLHMSVRRSPKRRSASIGTESSASVRSKRRRLSSPVESQTDCSEEALFKDQDPGGSYAGDGDDLTPSPTPTNLSLATATSEGYAPGKEQGSGVVTIAMLRALTRDMKKKYAGSG